jgi:protein-S-isoprenylcysteine O-methyltransferase Ste14
MFPFTKIVITGWIIFWLYWFIAASRSKRNALPSNMNRFIAVRLGLIVLAIILFRFLNVQNYSFQSRVISHDVLVPIAGLMILLSGLLLAIWARLYLGRNWGVPMSQKQDPELITSGPYHYIRHPIYAGILLAMLGSAIASSIFWLTILVISGVYFIYSAVIEEKIMTEQFPKDYPAYKRKTKMLIPFVI